MTAQLLLDLLMVGLLTVTVAYCTALSRKIARLRAGREDLAEVMAGFAAAIVKAEECIGRLKATGDQADAKLRHHIEQARALANDLSFLSSRGESVARSLEGKAHAPASQAATPARQRALEELLRQIAERKAEALRPEPEETKSVRAAVPFQPRRLADLVKATTTQ